MAKKKQPVTAWPWRVRGLYVVLGLSLFVNVLTISTLIKMAG